MGWGVIRAGNPANRLRYVQHGAITTPASWEMPRRLGRLFDGVSELVKGYAPDAVVIEELFFNTNVTTAITVGQARGVAILAAYRAGVEVFEYTPLQIKQAVTSYGRADKKTNSGDGPRPSKPARPPETRRCRRRPRRRHLSRLLGPHGWRRARQGRGGKIAFIPDN